MFESTPSTIWDVSISGVVDVDASLIAYRQLSVLLRAHYMSQWECNIANTESQRISGICQRDMSAEHMLPKFEKAAYSRTTKLHTQAVLCERPIAPHPMVRFQ